MDPSIEKHPKHFGILLARQLRGFQNILGMSRLANFLAKGHGNQSFIVKNNQGWFAGNLDSFLEREMYIRGNYEADFIEQFAKLIPKDKRSVLLDIGANIGTHSIPFARIFRAVHSFEPNQVVWDSFTKNVELNKLDNITLHKFALGSENAVKPFYDIDKNNHGLGTLYEGEQYDVPIKVVGTVNVRRGDDFVKEYVAKPISAIKIDVQGFEVEVLDGLKETIRLHKPIVWIEVEEHSIATLADPDYFPSLFSSDCDIYRLGHKRSGLIRRSSIEEMSRLDDRGNWVVAPRFAS